jgi:hypothetical protein
MTSSTWTKRSWGLPASLVLVGAAVCAMSCQLLVQVDSDQVPVPLVQDGAATIDSSVQDGGASDGAQDESDGAPDASDGGQDASDVAQDANADDTFDAAGDATDSSDGVPDVALSDGSQD